MQYERSISQANLKHHQNNIIKNIFIYKCKNICTEAVSNSTTTLSIASMLVYFLHNIRAGAFIPFSKLILLQCR